MKYDYHKYLWQKHVRTKFLLEGIECYKSTQMKTYDITKLAAHLKSIEKLTVQKKYIALLVVFVGVATESIYTSKSNLP